MHKSFIIWFPIYDNVFIKTDYYNCYLYLYNFRICDNLWHTHNSIINDQIKVRGRHQKSGFILTSCWYLWKRRTYLCNFLVLFKYRYIITALCISCKCVILGTKMMISQLGSSCSFYHTIKFLTPSLGQGRLKTFVQFHDVHPSVYFESFRHNKF